MIRFLGVLLISLPALAADPAPPEIQVFVVIGEARVPLSVDHRFSEVAGPLPKPGQMPIEDPHELGHDARTYCYRFGDELLEFFDSAFGAHTARLSRSSSAAMASCTAVRVRPEFEVAGRRLSLKSKQLPSLRAFTKKQEGQLVILERSWTYKADESRCSSRSVS